MFDFKYIYYIYIDFLTVSKAFLVLRILAQLIFVVKFDF